jgi:hypothetical protein
MKTSLIRTCLNHCNKGEKWCPEPELNQRHADFQSAALPTELSGHLARVYKQDVNDCLAFAQQKTPAFPDCVETGNIDWASAMSRGLFF